MEKSFNKCLVVTCDDEMFASGEIKLQFTNQARENTDSLRLCRLSLYLQYGDVAVLRKEDVENLIQKLNIVLTEI